jgi:hypothetical protein
VTVERQVSSIHGLGFRESNCLIQPMTYFCCHLSIGPIPGSSSFQQSFKAPSRICSLWRFHKGFPFVCPPSYANAELSSIGSIGFNSCKAPHSTRPQPVP